MHGNHQRLPKKSTSILAPRRGSDNNNGDDNALSACLSVREALGVGGRRRQIVTVVVADLPRFVQESLSAGPKDLRALANPMSGLVRF